MRALVITAALGALMFLCLPVLVVVPMSFSGAETLAFPPPSWSLQWYDSLFSNPIWIEAGRNSILLAASSSSIALIIGTLGAYAIVRGRFRGMRVFEANLIAPMVVPQIITAVALYIAFARAGILGTFGGLILGHVVLVTPYIVLVMMMAIRGFDEQVEQVAVTLGASRRQVLTGIVLPNVIPSALAAWIFAFVLSFDEVVVTLFISGTHLTIPKRMFNELLIQVNPTITAVATLLILFNILALLLLVAVTGGKRFAP